MATRHKPSIVFVHGIWAGSSSFNKLIPPLQAEGYEVLASQQRLDTLDDDIETVRCTIARAGIRFHRLQNHLLYIGLLGR
jgi:pimeloyl-ACP methyl ester carboxylesterase